MKKIGDITQTDKGFYEVKEVSSYKGQQITLEVGIRKGIPVTLWVVNDQTMHDSLEDAKQFIDKI